MSTTKKCFFVSVFILLINNVNSQCDEEHGLDLSNATSGTFIHEPNSCVFSLGCTARFSFEETSAACPMIQCPTNAYLWKLFLKPTGASLFSPLSSVCNDDQTFSFQNLTLPGTYKIIVEYRIANGFCPCVIVLDDIFFVIDNNMCQMITNAHSNNQGAIIKRSFDLIANCPIQNNKSTILLSETKVSLLKGFSSGIGSGTYFHAYIDNCASQAHKSAGSQNPEQTSFNTIIKLNPPDKTLFSVHPNPTSGELNITFPDSEKYPEFLKIINPTGQVIFTKTNFNDYHTDFNLLQFPQGIYLVNITYGDKTYSKKIIKQ